MWRSYCSRIGWPSGAVTVIWPATIACSAWASLMSARYQLDAPSWRTMRCAGYATRSPWSARPAKAVAVGVVAIAPRGAPACAFAIALLAEVDCGTDLEQPADNAANSSIGELRSRTRRMTKHLVECAHRAG